MTLSEAIEAVGTLLSRYPNGGQNAGDGYIGGLAAVLANYPRSIALRCHDPMKGVPRETKFLPTPSDLIAWCERETEAMRRPVEIEDYSAKLAREARERREEDERLAAERKTRPTLAQMKAKHGPNWGLKQSEDDGKARAASLARLERSNAIHFAEACEASGIDPAGGVSPALFAALQAKSA